MSEITHFGRQERSYQPAPASAERCSIHSMSANKLPAASDDKRNYKARHFLKQRIVAFFSLWRTSTYFSLRIRTTRRSLSVFIALADRHDRACPPVAATPEDDANFAALGPSPFATVEIDAAAGMGRTSRRRNSVRSSLITTRHQHEVAFSRRHDVITHRNDEATKARNQRFINRTSLSKRSDACPLSPTAHRHTGRDVCARVFAIRWPQIPF